VYVTCVSRGYRIQDTGYRTHLYRVLVGEPQDLVVDARIMLK
jgi:hypothetical protein